MAFPWNRGGGAAIEEPPPSRRRRRRQRRNQPADPQRQSARAHEERRRQRLAVTIGAMLILLIAAIVGVGYFREFYQPPRVMAGEVREQRFSMGDLVDRIRVLQGINRYQGGFVDLSTVPFEYLQNMLNAEILRQAAPTLGITPTDDQIDEVIRARFFPRAEPGQQTDPDQLEREFQNIYGAFLTSTRLSDQEYRVIVEEQITRQLLFNLLGAGVPETAQQVELEWIRLDIGGDIAPDEVRQRLENEEFAAVASEVMTTPDPFTDQATGYVGWAPEGAFPDLDQTIFGDDNSEPLAVGAISDPVFSQDGIYIIHKLSGLEERDLEGPMRFKLNAELVKDWENEQLTIGSDEGWVKINFNSDRYAWVADQVRLTAPRTGNNQFQPNQGR